MWPANRFPSPGNRPWTFFGNFKPLFYTEQPEYWKSKPIVHLYTNYSVLTSIFGVFLAFLGLVIFMFPVGARVVVGDWELSSYVTRDIDGFEEFGFRFVFKFLQLSIPQKWSFAHFSLDRMFRNGYKGWQSWSFVKCGSFCFVVFWKLFFRAERGSAAHYYCKVPENDFLYQ